MTDTTIIPRVKGDAVVLEFNGKLNIGSGDWLLRESILKQLEEGHRNIILDARNMRTIDSSGIGELITAYTTITSAGGTFKLAGLKGKPLEGLNEIGLIHAFDVYPTTEDALSALKQ